MKKKHSLNRQVWKYLILFSILILAFLWFFQVVFLKSYYEWVKTRDIKEVAKQVQATYESNEFEELIDQAAYDKSICVEITTREMTTVYSTDIMNRGCLREQPTNLRLNYKYDFINSTFKHQTYTILNPRFDNKTLIYALQLDTNLYAFINTSLEPIDSTALILKDQFIYVSLIVLGLSFIVAYFISRKISAPIIKINQAAKKMASGAFNVVFDTGENIDELAELAATLQTTSQELAKTDELRRDLMANVSHDLKTPLTMIRAYSEMARDLNADNTIKREENLNIIIDEVDRLTLLVNDILDLSSMQSEITKLHLTTFDLTELICSVLKQFKIFQLTESYHFIFESDGPCTIEADRKKIEQVVYNLIGNAINYTGEDHTVTVTISSQKEKTKVMVRDSGAGIRPQDVPHIWDKYYKNQKHHKRNTIGTGLGLSIVKNILLLHHYSFGVISKKNKGTTFFFEISKKDSH